MKESWVCKDYETGDEQQILRLFADVFQREMSLTFWKWRFIENPFVRGIIKLLFDVNKLIGHYAVIPMEVQVQGEPLKAVFSMSTMTHPDYGGQGIFTYLAEEVYRLCQDRGFRFVYGFPNTNSYAGFTHKLRWHCMGKMTILEKRLRGPIGERPPRGRFTIKEVERFDNVINLLWDKVKRDYHIIVPRTEGFMNWRFVENPEVGYKKFIIYDNDDILGYIILKIYAGGDVKKGHIVDMLGTGNEDAVKIMLQSSYDYFLERDIYDISCWIPGESFYSSILKGEGFIRGETETYFGVRVFNEADSLDKITQQHGNWFITMGDSDVF